MPGCGCLNNSVCPKCGRLKAEDSCLDKSKGRWSFAEWQVSLNLRWIEHSCRRFLFGYWGWWQNHRRKTDPWQTVRRIKDIQSISKLSQMPGSASRTLQLSYLMVTCSKLVNFDSQMCHEEGLFRGWTSPAEKTQKTRERQDFGLEERRTSRSSVLLQHVYVF